MTKLYFYYSSMNAGKSAFLLQNNFNYNERGLKTLLFTPSITGETEIKSRTGLKTDAIVFDSQHNFMTYDYRDVSAIFVDEAQFLTRQQVIELCEIVDTKVVRVYCYGIRSDFQGEPFEGSKYLLTLADSIIEIKTICDCGSKATMNKRLTNENGQVEIGRDKYKSVCRGCFNQSESRLH